MGTLSTASSDGVGTRSPSRRASSICGSGCNTPMISYTGLDVEQRRERRGSSVSGCNTPSGWAGSTFSESEVDQDLGSCSPRIDEYLQSPTCSPTLKQRRQRCARVVSALAQNSAYGYRSLQSAFEAMDKNGDGRLSIDELKTLLETVGLSEKTTVGFFETLRGSHGDSIDYKQFLATYAPAVGNKSGLNGRMWPRWHRMLREIPSSEGLRWCLY